MYACTHEYVGICVDATLDISKLYTSLIYTHKVHKQMLTCVYIHVYIYTTYIPIDMIRICMYVCMHVCMYVHTCRQRYRQTDGPTDKRTNTQPGMQAGTQTFVYTYTYVYIYKHIYILHVSALYKIVYVCLVRGVLKGRVLEG